MRKGVERIATQSATPPETSRPSTGSVPPAGTCRRGASGAARTSPHPGARVRAVPGRAARGGPRRRRRRESPAGDLLVGLVALPAMTTTSPGGRVERKSDGDGAVGLDHEIRASVAARRGTPTPATSSMMAARVLVPRVVRREERHVDSGGRHAAPSAGAWPGRGCPRIRRRRAPARPASERPRLGQHDLETGRCVGIVHEDGEGSSAGSSTSAPRLGSYRPCLIPARLSARRSPGAAPGPARRGPSPPRSLGPELRPVEGQRRLGRQEGVVDVDRTGQRRRDPLPAPGELGAARPSTMSRRVAVADGDGRDAGAVEQPLAPRVVRIDDAAQRVSGVKSVALASKYSSMVPW